MKIAFVGKGGSGKTTISSLFARYLASQNLPVLAIDADINQHLGVALGFNEGEVALIPSMGKDIRRIKEYLRGTNTRITSIDEMSTTTPPGSGSHLLTVDESNPIYDYFGKQLHSIRLLATGPFLKEDLGLRCYHSKQGAAEIVLNHLKEKDGEYVVVDMTAGADSFASGLFAKFDITFLVVEPTLKSVGVYQQYMQYARDYDITIKVVGNKVDSKDDLAFLQDHIGDSLVGCLKSSELVKAMEKGRAGELSQLEPQNLEVLKQLQQVVSSIPKNYSKLYEHTLKIHKRSAENRPEAAQKDTMLSQIDPAYSF